MGADLCSNNISEPEKEETFTLMTSFIPINHSVNIRTQHQLLFDRIKNRLTVIDPRNKPELSWFQSVKYNLYLYGKLQKGRPIGDSFFYIKDDAATDTPIIISTNVNQHFVFSQQTLIIYPDQIVYYGSIRNNIASLPRAEGKGTLFCPHFVYEGQFKNGLPHGFGNYRSRTLQFLGNFKYGQPYGQGLQKSANELFVGTVEQNGIHKGFKITRNNQKIPVSSGYQLDRISIKQPMGV